MIPADAHLEVAWLPVADVVPLIPQPLDLDKISYYMRLMDGPDEGHLAPPMVNAPDDRGRHGIRDGRHRWASHVALGRERIRCVVVKE